MKPALYKCKIDFDFDNPDLSKKGMPLLKFEEVLPKNKNGKGLNSSPATGAISMIEWTTQPTKTKFERMIVFILHYYYSV